MKQGSPAEILDAKDAEWLEIRSDVERVAATVWGGIPDRKSNVVLVFNHL
jgi:hypothetical protein